MVKRVRESGGKLVSPSPTLGLLFAVILVCTSICIYLIRNIYISIYIYDYKIIYIYI